MKKEYFFFVTFFFHSIINITFANSSVKNVIIANVETQIVSSYELKNKIKTILFLSNQELNQDSINQNKSLALKSRL